MSSSGARTAPGQRSSMESTSGFSSSGKASTLTFTGRWQAWRGPSANGADSTPAHYTLKTIDESSTGSYVSNSPAVGSGYDSNLTTTTVSEFGFSCGTDSSGQGVRTVAGSSVGQSAESSTVVSPASSVGLHGFSRLRNNTAALTASAGSAAATPLRPSSASVPLRPSLAASSQPRSEAGLPLGKSVEEFEQEAQTAASAAAARNRAAVTVQVNPSGAALVVLPATAAAAAAASHEGAAAQFASATASTAPSSTLATDGSASATRPAPKARKARTPASKATEPHINNNGGLDSSLTKTQARSSCCRCSWLRTNVQSMGWKLDPWVILLSLLVSCAALAAGAVQLAVRARTPEQQSAIQQVSCLRPCVHVMHHIDQLSPNTESAWPKHACASAGYCLPVS